MIHHDPATNIAPDERIDVVNESLRLIQKKQGLTFGTDAFLLAAFIRPMPHARAVELGEARALLLFWRQPNKRRQAFVQWRFKRSLPS